MRGSERERAREREIDGERGGAMCASLCVGKGLHEKLKSTRSVYACTHTIKLSTAVLLYVESVRVVAPVGAFFSKEEAIKR